MKQSFKTLCFAKDIFLQSFNLANPITKKEAFSIGFFEGAAEFRDLVEKKEDALFNTMLNDLNVSYCLLKDPKMKKLSIGSDQNRKANILIGCSSSLTGYDRLAKKTSEVYGQEYNAFYFFKDEPESQYIDKCVIGNYCTLKKIAKTNDSTYVFYSKPNKIDDDYYYLSFIDCAVMNCEPPHFIEQIYLLLFSGIKIYFNDNNPYIKFFREKGVTVNSLSELKGKTPEELRTRINKDNKYLNSLINRDECINRWMSFISDKE